MPDDYSKNNYVAELAEKLEETISSLSEQVKDYTAWGESGIYQGSAGEEWWEYENAVRAINAYIVECKQNALNQKEEMIREKLEGQEMTPVGPNTMKMEEFESAMREWLENVLAPKSTEAAVQYLDFLKDGWENEIEPYIPYRDLPIEECNTIVQKIITEKKSEYAAKLTKISKATAVEEFLYRLAKLKAEKEAEFIDSGVDEETITLELQRYFEELKNNYLQATGEFYEETVDLAKKISPESDQEDFLSNVPNYIEQFLNDTFGGIVEPINNWFNAISIVMDAVALKFLYVPRILYFIVPGAIVEVIESLLVTIGNENGLLGFDKLISVDNLFFNEVPLTDIDVFNFSEASGSSLSGNNVLLNLRKNVAGWYYALRNLSIVMGLLVLIYIGIRMAMSSIADDKAKYKKMFKDWLISFALIFVLQYLMIFIIGLNNEIVDVLKTARDAETTEFGIKLPFNNQIDVPLQERILLEAFHPSVIRGWTATILYVGLVAMTFLFTIVYIKRLITICFLVIISPLITITYAIDKAGDGRAQALNKWLKEFVFTILIQPFHCIIYMVFLQNMMYVITNTTTVFQFGKCFVALVLLGFMYKAEDIVKSIFGFEAKNLSSATVLGAAAISKVGKVNSIKTVATGMKDAKAKAAAINNINTPEGLPSNAKIIPAQNTSQEVAQQATQGGQANTSKLGKAWNVVKPTNGPTAKRLAKRAFLGAVGYGLTGEYTGAIAADKAGASVGKKIDEIKLASSIKNKQQNMLDAYQDYKEYKGLSNQEMLAKSKELLGADIDSLTDAADRNLAGYLQANKAMQGELLGAGEAKKEEKAEKAVMKQLYDYEGF